MIELCVNELQSNYHAALISRHPATLIKNTVRLIATPRNCVKASRESGFIDAEIGRIAMQRSLQLGTGAWSSDPETLRLLYVCLGQEHCSIGFTKEDTHTTMLHV